MINYYCAMHSLRGGQNAHCPGLRRAHELHVSGCGRRWGGTFLAQNNKIKGQPGAPEAVLEPSRLEGQRDDHNLSPLYCKIMDER
jgi:hypothetical protein